MNVDSSIHPFSDTEVARFRAETQGCKFVNHLNNAGASLMPDVVTASIKEHIQLEAEIGGYEASDLKAKTILEFYEEAAALINARPHNIAFTASATDSFARALSSIPFERGDVILTDRDGFISNQIQFLSLQKRLGVKLVRVDNDPTGGVNVADLEQKLHSMKPKLLSITHIPTNSGLVQPVEKIASAYKTYIQKHGDNTWYILDACQSIGQRPVDVQALRCDFLSVTNRKFLRGPRGTGFLFISDKALNAGLEPMFLDMRGADWIADNEYRQQRTAKRFEDWEFAYALVIGSTEAIRYCRAVSEKRIQQRVTDLNSYLRRNLSTQKGARVLDRGNEISSTVTLAFANSSADNVVNGLRNKHINVVASYRHFAVLDFNEKNVDWALRVSPHYYNTYGEIDSFLEALPTLV